MDLRERLTRIPLPSMNKAVHSGFETERRHHQKSKTGVSVIPQKDKNFKKVWYTPSGVVILDPPLLIKASQYNLDSLYLRLAD